MKKMLLTLTTAGALAIPVGVLVAESDPAEPADPAPTTTEAEPVQDRARRNVEDPAAGERPGNEAGDCDGECDCDGTQAQERQQNRLEEGTGEGTQAHNRQQNRLEEDACNGPMARQREQNRLEEGTGDGTQAHNRQQNRLEEETGDEPVAPEPEQNRVEDGSGEQAPAEDSDTTTPDDGANLQRQYGEGSGRGNR